MQAILHFIYLGEATVHQDRMKDFLQVGIDLGIKELREYHDIATVSSGGKGNKMSNKTSFNDEHLVQYNPKSKNKPKMKLESIDEALAGFTVYGQYPCDVCSKV